jgi:hypothetical protein
MEAQRTDPVTLIEIETTEKIGAPERMKLGTAMLLFVLCNFHITAEWVGVAV